MPFEFREERLASNPVALLQAKSLDPQGEARLCEQLLDRGMHLPAYYLEHLGLDPSRGRSRHGVVGCVVEASELGWVDRLQARPSSTWKSRSGLPFDALELEAMLLALLSARGEELMHLLPEARCFELTDELQTAIMGESMTVAAALAVLDCTSGGKRPEFAALLSLVQRTEPGADQLAPVECVSAKLAAFERECGRGSLCIVARGDQAALDLAASRFDEVWEVVDLCELGRHLDQRGLLDDLAKLDQIDRRALGNIEGLLRQMGREDWLVGRNLDLARRLQAAGECVGFGRDVSFAQRRGVGRHLLGPLRLEAALGEVVPASRKVFESVGPEVVGVTHEERAVAMVNLAAAYFVVYEFDEVVQLLTPLRQSIEADRDAYSPLIRSRVLGTLGRAFGVLGGDWRACFDEAIELLSATVPGELVLARGFYVGALLANGCLDEVEEQLDQAQSELLSEGYRDNISLWFQAFNRADLARRGGALWESAEMDSGDVLRPGQFGRPLGYYFQATARQALRSPGDAAKRFHRAAEAFGAGDLAVDSGQWLLVHLMRLGAAERGGDSAAWSSVREDLLSFLAQPFAAGLAAWHGVQARALPEGLDDRACRPALEALLKSDPYLLGAKHREAAGALD